MRIVRKFEKWGLITSIKVGLTTILITLLSATGFYYFESPYHENLTWLDGLWWAFVTMTTVGYGDISPVTIIGRYFIAFPTMLIGISVLGYTLSAVGTSLFERHSLKRKGLMPIKNNNHVIIIHYPGDERMKIIINQLRADSKTKDKDIVIIDDKLDSIPSLLSSENILFVTGVPTKEEVLNRANVKGASHVIVLSRGGVDADNRSLAIVLVVEQMHPNIHSVVECLDPERIPLIKSAGADSVVCLEKLSANLLIQELMDPGVQDIVSQMISNTIGSQIYIIDPPFEDKHSMQELKVIREKLSGVNIIGVQIKGKYDLNPHENMHISGFSKLICIAKERPKVLYD